MNRVKLFPCLTALIVVALTVAHGPAWANPFEPPSIGEVMAERIGEAVEAARAYSAEKQVLSSKIQVARTRFFKLYPDGKGFQQAETEFSDLLYVKDVHYLSLYLVEGPSADATKRAQAMGSLTGGEVDDGIQPRAWRAFADWVNAVRRPLGGDSPGQKILVLSEKKLMDAIKASAPAYARYKAQRDALEFANAGIELPGSKPDMSAKTIASYVPRWETQCNAEDGFKPAGAERRKWCQCMVTGLERLANISPISTETREALAQAFLDNISRVEQETGMATAYTGKCFR